MLVGGCVLVKSGNTIRSSKWFGKAATVVLYTIMIIIILFSVTAIRYALYIKRDCSRICSFCIYHVCTGIFKNKKIRVKMIAKGYTKHLW